MTSEEGDMEDLLDSALDDFDNLPKPAKVTKKKTARKQEARMADSGPPSEEDFLKIFQSVGGQGDATALQAGNNSLDKSHIRENTRPLKVCG